MGAPEFISVQDEDGGKHTVNLNDVARFEPDEDNPKQTLVIIRGGGSYLIPMPHGQVQQMVSARFR